MTEEAKPYVLSIAGFDPSAGAGVLADIKTFESTKVYGLGICTSLTFQNDREFEGVKWVPPADILKQSDVLFKRFPIHWVKIGLIENLEVLEKVVDHLHKAQSGIRIIWDPILKASAGFVFHENTNREQLDRICRKIYLLTPNLEEIKKLVPGTEPLAGAGYLNSFCNVLLKGGHGSGPVAKDILFSEGKETYFESEKINGSKHGTGCVLSSAILAHLAKGTGLEDACAAGKEYITGFIKSDSGLLGYHYA